MFEIQTVQSEIFGGTFLAMLLLMSVICNIEADVDATDMSTLVIVDVAFAYDHPDPQVRFC